MPDRYCSTCHQVIPASDWRRHYDRHETQARERYPTPGHQRQRARILERARHHCERCGAAPTPGKPLELHHIDGDWRNATDDQRVTILCHDCHVATYTERPKIIVHQPGR